MAPKFSVITPSYNYGRFIRQTIESVMAQQEGSYEHIIIDGGSTDETLSIIGEFPHIKLVTEPDRGQADALNKAFTLASGEIIAWINADDWYAPNIFSEVYKNIINSQWVIGWCTVTDAKGAEKYTVKNAGRNWFDLIRYWIPYSIPTQPSIFFRREAALQVVYNRGIIFDESLQFCMDYDLWLRMYEKFEPPKLIDKVLSYYRMHEESKTNDESDWLVRAQPEMSRVAKQAVSRVLLPKRQISVNLSFSVADTRLTDAFEHWNKTLRSSFNLTVLQCQPELTLKLSALKLRKLIARFDPVAADRRLMTSEPGILSSNLKSLIQSSDSEFVIWLPYTLQLEHVQLIEIEQLFSDDQVAMVIFDCFASSSNPISDIFPENLINGEVKIQAFAARSIALIEQNQLIDSESPDYLFLNCAMQLLQKGWRVLRLSTSSNIGHSNSLGQEFTEHCRNYLNAQIIINLNESDKESQFSTVRLENGFSLPQPEFLIEECRRFLSKAPTDWLLRCETKRCSELEDDILSFSNFAPYYFLLSEIWECRSNTKQASYYYHEAKRIGLEELSISTKTSSSVSSNSIANNPVSVIIPCRDHGVFLTESVQSVINQGYKNCEIIIIDDGSVDSTPEIGRNLERSYPDKVKYERRGGVGVSAARNRGIELSKGSFILPLDADDVLLPWALEKLVPALEKEPNIGFSFGGLEFLDALPGEPEYWRQGPINYELFPYENQVPASSLWKRELFEQGVKYRDVQYEDWDLWLQIVSKHKVGVYVPYLTYRYRVNNGGRHSKNRFRKLYGLSEHAIFHQNLYTPQFRDIAQKVLAAAPACYDLPTIAILFATEEHSLEPQFHKLIQHLKNKNYFVTVYGSSSDFPLRDILQVTTPSLFQSDDANSLCGQIDMRPVGTHMETVGSELIVISTYDEHKLLKLTPENLLFSLSAVGVSSSFSLIRRDQSVQKFSESKASLQDIDRFIEFIELHAKEERSAQIFKESNISKKSNLLKQSENKLEKNSYFWNPPKNNLSVTVIIPIRNINELILERCLISIRNSTGLNSVEIVVVNLATTRESHPSLVELLRRYNVNLIHVNWNGHWNRGFALNIGIKRSKSEWIICTDSDMIFHPDLMSIWSDYVAEFGSRALYLSQCHRLSPLNANIPLSLSREEFSKLCLNGRKTDFHSEGGFQCIRKDWLEYARGFNEQFHVWGMEDNELSLRATSDGLEKIWLPSGLLLHQWHIKCVPEDPISKNREKFNEIISNLTVKSNPNGWGGDGQLPDENLQFRDSPLRAKANEISAKIISGELSVIEREILLLDYAESALELNEIETAFEGYMDLVFLNPKSYRARLGLAETLEKKQLSVQSQHERVYAKLLS